jgi:uncharacterized protein YjbJ (UPF0337 family)/PHD/YefM family antitoxin component YafN of YafNO toxin-antitoxin module
MKYLTVTKARASFLRLVDNLAERTAIMRNGQPVAVLLDFDDYRGLCAAQALARDPERLAEIQAVARRVRAGDLTGFEEAPEVRDNVETASAAKATMEEPLARRHTALDHDLPRRRATPKKGMWVRDDVESPDRGHDVAWSFKNADSFKGQWTQLRGMVREQWGKLTDADLDQIQGRSEQLIGKLQERYGIARDEAERQVDAMTQAAGDLATKRRDR